MPITEVKYPISIRNEKKITLSIENGPWHKLVYIEPIVTTQGNHFNGLGVVHIIFGIGKYVKTGHVKEIPICITIGIPPHNVISNKSVPLDPRGNLLEP
jgi:hypothetical protein